jgi:hypothetical protein
VAAEAAGVVGAPGNPAHHVLIAPGIFNKSIYLIDPEFTELTSYPALDQA